jgi:hypothetical protein
MTPLAGFISELRSSPNFAAALECQPALAVSIDDARRFFIRLDADVDGALGAALRAELERIVSGAGGLKEKLAAVETAICKVIGPMSAAKRRLN